MERHMKNTALAILAVIALGPAAQQKPPVEALDGVDPVLLVQGKEVQGKKDFSIAHDGFQYLFSSAATKGEFQQNPARYEIQMHGLCARMGKATGANPSDYLVYDGKIYIFGSDECHRRFQENPKKYLATPPPPLDSSTKAVSEGKALLQRALTALGGAAKVEAITTYVETASQVQQRAAGPAPLTTKTMWRFPGEVRMERTVTLPDRAMSSATLMTPAGMWYVSQGHAYPAPEAGRPSMQLDYGRQIVPLLHGRGDRSFKAAALGQRTVEGLTVNLLRVVNGGVDVTLGVDPSSGRIQTIAFADRNDQGEVGEYVIVYSDYRGTAGLMLPFAERAMFNGVADPSLMRRIDTIQINVPLDPELFRPGTTGQ
jgi:YHS domain-containing protein